MTQENKNGSKAKKVRHIIWRSIQILLLVLLAAGVILAVYFYSKYGKRILGMQEDAVRIVKEGSVEDFKKSQTSLVYDTEGNLISTLKGAKEVYYLDYEDIPQTAIDAMVAVEDRKFWTHSGIDIKGIMRAGVALLKNKGEIKQGASTITQQVARNIYLTHQETWERKIKEIFIALELEKKYNKKQIMEFYLNNIYFANGFYGIQAAAMGYFNKSANEVSLSQMAFLCAVPNNPTIYDPVVNMKKTLARRDRILDQLLGEGNISEEECSKAKKEKIHLKMQKTDKKDYVETFAYYCAIRALMEADGFVFRNEFVSAEDKEEYDTAYSESYNVCQQSLYNSGYRIYTSLDMTKQDELQAAVDQTLAGFTEVNEEGIFALQGAAVSIDNDTGRVIAIVGGRSQETAGYTLNRAYQSYRQPGSAIKPLIVYTPHFEKGLDPEDIVVDEKKEEGPKNFDDTYIGSLTVRKAIEVSKNTVAWDLFQELTPQAGLRYLLDMNFSRISEKDYVPAAAIGGFSTGVSPVELTSGFAAIENKGVYRTPTCIIKIMDSDGNEIVPEAGVSKTIYEQEACLKMISCMKSAMESTSGRRTRVEGMPTAGKTGTTNDRKDGWFVGFTAYYTTGVWVGYDMPRYLEGLSGSSYPSQIWHTYMTPVHEGLAPLAFEDYVHKVIEVPEEPEPELPEEPLPPEESLLPPEDELPEEDQLPEDVPEDIPEDIPDDFPEDFPEDWPEEDQLPEDWPEDTPDEEGGTETLPGDENGNEAGEDTGDDVTEPTPGVIGGGDEEDFWNDGSVDPEDAWFYEGNQQP